MTLGEDFTFHVWLSMISIVECETHFSQLNDYFFIRVGINDRLEHYVGESLKSF